MAKIILLGLLYWLFCWMGTLTFYKDFGLAIYWPAAGVAIMGIYILGRSSSIGIFIAAFIINYFIYRTGYINLFGLIISVTAIAAGNTIGAIIGARCLEIRVLKKNRSFFRLDSIFAFLLFVVIIPSLITSLTGGIVIYLSDVVPDYFNKVHSWLLADLIGILVIVPLVIAWKESPGLKINRQKIPEFLIISILLFVSSYFIFTDFFENYFYNFLIAYFTIPIYFWLAFRFDSKTIISLQFLALFYISYLAIYVGDYFFSILSERPYILLQGFSILIAMLILIVHSIYKERQQYITDIHRNEQDLKDVLTNLPLGVGILNRSGEPEFLNKEFTNKTGLSLAEFSNKDFSANSVANTGQTINLLTHAWKSFIRDFMGGESIEKDISLLNKNHEAREYSLYINPLKDRYLMVMMDITQRKKMLEKIKEDERRLSSLIQNLQGMVYQCRFDRNWTMEFVSEGSFLLTGYLPSDLVLNSHLPFVSIIQERFRDYVWDTIESAIKRGEPYSLQYQIVTRSGELKWVAENGNGIFGTDGICRSLEGIIYDITDRVEAMEAYQSGEEKYRSLFENMPVSLWENDYSEIKQIIDSWPANLKEDIYYTLITKKELYLELVSNIKIVDMNRSTLEMYGEKNKSKLIEKGPEIFASGNPEAFSSVLTSFVEGKSNLEERIMEVKIMKKKRFLSVRWFIMPGYERDLSRILLTIVDITDLKKAEKEIRLLNQSLEKKVRKRTEDLGRANQELEAFSYSVSHDLKAPLRAIRGFSLLLMQEYGNSLPDGAIHYIKNVQKNSENMTLLITDLLQFSRLGRKSLVYTTFDSFRLVNTILQDLYSHQNPENTEFIVNGLPILKADETLLTQVFVNLFSNAIKFSKPGLKNRIEISCKSNSEYHEFCVSDQGIGFEQKHAEKIFKVFQRLHTPQEYEGSGVGLSLVQRIIHRHGGIIHAKSEKGKGTNIFFTIPVEIDSEYEN